MAKGCMRIYESKDYGGCYGNNIATIPLPVIKHWIRMADSMHGLSLLLVPEAVHLTIFDNTCGAVKGSHFNLDVDWLIGPWEIKQ